MSFTHPSSIRSRAQRGAALITSLLMLVVLTILGVTTLQMSRMQERMTGNTRDANVAFQGAEAAVRSGETFIGKQSVRPIARAAPPSKCTTVPCVVYMNGTAGGNGRVEFQSDDWWVENGTTGDAFPKPLPETPVYVVEEIGFVRTDGGVVLGEEDGRDFYQISGRSTGASGQADVVVQTTYARKF